MASVGLPSVLLWHGMQSRASALPLLMQEAFQNDNPVTMQRVRDSLCQLAALSCFVQIKQFSLFCRECIKLFDLYEQQLSRRKTIAPVLLCAALRVSQSLERPLICSIDSASLNELRQARGAKVVDQVAQGQSAAWTIPRLKILLHKQLLLTHYTLGDTSNLAESFYIKELPNSFYTLNKVAALCFGNVLLTDVSGDHNIQQTCLQILRVELSSTQLISCASLESFSAMKSVFFDLTIVKVLNILSKEVNEISHQVEILGTLDLQASLSIFNKVSICSEFINRRELQAISNISISAQQLALHLLCWEANESEENSLLCLCTIALERQINIVIAVLQSLRPCERVDIRLRRKIQHFIRTHRRRYRTEYAVPIKGMRDLANEELKVIHQMFCANLKRCKQEQVFKPVEDDFVHALIRFKAIALYIGEMGLYELIWSLREILTLAIESKLQFKNFPVSLLPRLSAYALRFVVRKQVVIGYDAVLISRLSEKLRAKRQIEFFLWAKRDERVSIPEHPGAWGGRQSISTAKLPRFLAKNIHELITDPVAIYDCQSSEEFAQLSRGLILELTLLAHGARVLHVDRVAALCEVLLEIYRSLNGLSVLPKQRDIKQNLQCGHRCLRLALNQAAARQKVSDVRPVIISLYHFLECLHQVPTHNSGSLQSVQVAVNSLAADMRGLADIMADAFDHSHSSRNQLANEQMKGLLAATRSLQEDIAANGMISIARWGPSMRIVVGRFSNELGKPARLYLALDAIQAPRELVQQIQSQLQSLLCLIIQYSIESPKQRRSIGKADCASLCLRATHSDALLTVTLEDDGAGLSLNQLEIATNEIEVLGGTLTLAQQNTKGSHLSLTIPCASVRWDIASKSL